MKTFTFLKVNKPVFSIYEFIYIYVGIVWLIDMSLRKI